MKEKMSLYSCPGVVQDAVHTNLFQIDLRDLQDSAVLDARMESVRLGSIGVSSFYRSGSQYGSRRWDHIRGDRIDCFMFFVPLSTPCFIEQSAYRNEVTPGQFTFVATNRPFQIAQYAGKQGVFSTLQAMVPGALLRMHLPYIDDLSNKSFPVNAGIGRITTELLEACMRDGAMLSTPGADEMGSALLNMITGTAQWAAASCGTRVSVSEASAKRILVQAKSFIDNHLDDPALDTDMVARNCQISIRYLQAIFNASDESVAAYIREKRLTLCRDALKSPKMATRTITEIAGQWGFEDISQFGRAYKKLFGITPRQERGNVDLGK